MISLVLMSSFRISAGDFSMRRQRFAYARLSHSYMTRLTRAFSVSFTTGPFGPSRIRLFEASPYRAGSEELEYLSNWERYSSFIFRTARCVSASSCHNHPQSLTEPCLTLSRHTARAIAAHLSAAFSPGSSWSAKIVSSFSAGITGKFCTPTAERAAHTGMLKIS